MHVYPLIASVLVIVGMHARLIYHTATQTKPAPASRARAPYAAAGDVAQYTPAQYAPAQYAPAQYAPAPAARADYSDLIMQLQAAKKAHGMA